MQILICSNVSLADSTDVSIINDLRNIASSLKENANKDEQRRLDLSSKIDSLKSLVEGQAISNEKAKKELKKLETIIDIERNEEAKIQNKYNQIQLNFDKYVFKTRAQKVFPFLYAAAALYIADGGADEKILYSFAGYGIGSLVENTGYGISAGVTLLRYSINF